MKVPRASYSFRMSFWIVPPSFSDRRPCLSATVSYMRSRIEAVALIVIEVVTRSQRDPVEEPLHVLERVDRDADLADLAQRRPDRSSRTPSVSEDRRRPTGRSVPGSSR